MYMYHHDFDVGHEKKADFSSHLHLNHLLSAHIIVFYLE